jgi:hypothetical protein
VIGNELNRRRAKTDGARRKDRASAGKSSDTLLLSRKTRTNDKKLAMKTDRKPPRSGRTFPNGVVDAVSALLGIRSLQGGFSNKHLTFLLALFPAVLWRVGGHLGGEKLRGADTFPAFH